MRKTIKTIRAAALIEYGILFGLIAVAGCLLWLYVSDRLMP